MHKTLIIVLSLFVILSGCAAANKPTSQLIQDLKHHDRDTKLSAAWVLGDRGEEAVPALIESLSEPDKGIQYASIWSLANIGTMEAKEALKTTLPMLENDLSDEDTETRETASELLTIISTPEAFAILEKHGIHK